MVQATELHIRRSALGDISAAVRELVPAAGQLLVHIDLFALTANNMTYAAHGIDMGYWGFFPAPDGMGIVPVWGFATVIEGSVDGITIGDRFYGYWPLASHALVTPIKITPRGFVDGAPNRQALPPVYNNYVPASPAFGAEAVQALFRPLYTTSFVLDVMLQTSPAHTLVLTSASSKTALGLAQAAHGRQRVIGLTSPANRNFVIGTGYFDAVLAYDDLAALADEAGPAAFIDFSGNGKVRRAVHETLGTALIESHIVGDTHWDAANDSALPGVAPQLFFAPTVIVERVAEWGPQGFEERLTAAWTAFMASTGWLRVTEGRGAAAAMAQWQALATGRIDPAEGVVISL